MFQKPSKYLASEEGGTPASAAAAPPVPAEPAAAPTAPALDVDSLLTRLSGVIDEKITASQNATHAALRKAGIFKQDKPPGEPTPATPSSPTPSAPSAQAGLSMADVEALLERENVIATRVAKHSLTDAQARRLKSALTGVERGSFASEADSYLADLGLVKAATPPPQPTVPTTPAPAAPAPAKPNLSDRGTAAPTDTRDSEGVLNSRPLEMTGHDVDALILKHGHEKGLQMYQERVLSALRGVRIKTPRG
jgi:hypothetical protein